MDSGKISWRSFRNVGVTSGRVAGNEIRRSWKKMKKREHVRIHDLNNGNIWK